MAALLPSTLTATQADVTVRRMVNGVIVMVTNVGATTGAPSASAPSTIGSTRNVPADPTQPARQPRRPAPPTPPWAKRDKRGPGPRPGR